MKKEIVYVVVGCIALITCGVAYAKSVRPVSSSPDMSTSSDVTSVASSTSDESCEQRWGAHAVSSGASDSDNVPICSCAAGYMWHNDDGTIGTTYGPGEQYDFISAPGKCVEQ